VLVQLCSGPYGCGLMHQSMLVHGVQYVRGLTVDVECCAECALYLKLFELAWYKFGTSASVNIHTLRVWALCSPKCSTLVSVRMFVTVF
jgi:hypothetical protein